MTRGSRTDRAHPRPARNPCPTLREPTRWLFDGSDPRGDLPTAEADAVESMRIEYEEPLYAPLPETAVEAVRELFRGFHAHTPYRRLATIEQADDQTILVTGEKRSSKSDADGFEPHIHDRDVEAMQSELTDFFGPLWRVRRRSGAAGRDPIEGRVVIRRVVGRRFHHPGTEGDRQ
ncbi:MAG: hypothetical protein U5K70_05605 [Halodesulfurarchaeum sp.]|nr:hypothetical protein [Halodesulfurarchaeum sp.]